MSVRVSLAFVATLTLAACGESRIQPVEEAEQTPPIVLDAGTDQDAVAVSADAGQVADAAAQPADSGVAEPADSGVVTPADSGVATPADSGVAEPADSGVVVPADSGVVTPADSGVVTPADSGVVTPADSGVVVPADSGVVTPADSGVVVPADSGVPPDAGFVDSGVAPDAGRTGVGVLGWGTHSVSNVNLTVVSRPTDGLNVPRDLAFNPYSATPELWVVNRADDSTVTYFNPGTPNQRTDKRIDPYALHFMEEVSSIAFGQPGRFATCQESRNTYNGQGRANDFMGPSLWPSDMNIYGYSNPAAVRANGGSDLGSHVDMLHESPLCMGIAWESANAYWTFDGLTGSISRYDFQRDHGPGYDDHSDGIIVRWVTGQVARSADTPSHLAYDPATRRLYIADTGNRRIGVLDTTTGTNGSPMSVKEPGTQLRQRNGATVTTLVAQATGGFVRPSGIALTNQGLFVTDNGNGRISLFDLNGARIDYLDTGLPAGALMGITTDTAGNLWIVDASMNRLLRISARP